MTGATVAAGRETIERARADGKKALVIVMSKGGADMAYTALNLATAARAHGMEVHIYFAFWGMQLLSPEGRNQSMDVLSPEMRKAVAEKYPTLEELLRQAGEAGVYIHACSPTTDWYGLTKEPVENVGIDILGPATYLERASRPNVLTLFI